MTGFGDSWMRPIMADIQKFPSWAVLRASDLAKRQVSLMQLPVCVDDVKWLFVFPRILMAEGPLDLFLPAGHQ